MLQKNRHWILKEDQNRKTKIKNHLLDIFGEADLTWKNIVAVSYHPNVMVVDHSKPGQHLHFGSGDTMGLSQN